MITLLLKISAIMVALLIIFLTLLKKSGIGIAIRITKNVFNGQIANVALSTWLILILVMIEILFSYF